MDLKEDLNTIKKKKGINSTFTRYFKWSNTSVLIQYHADSRKINLKTDKGEIYKMGEQGVLQRRDSRYFGILLRQRRVNGPESIGLAHRRAKRVWWKLKPLDGIGRAVKYCLHRLVCLSQPLSFLNPFWTPPFRRRILPSRRNQKLNVVAFISPSRLHPPLSSTPPPFLTPPPSPYLSSPHARSLQPSFRCRFHHRIGEYAFLLSI